MDASGACSEQFAFPPGQQQQQPQKMQRETTIESIDREIGDFLWCDLDSGSGGVGVSAIDDGMFDKQHAVAAPEQYQQRRPPSIATSHSLEQQDLDTGMWRWNSNETQEQYYSRLHMCTPVPGGGGGGGGGGIFAPVPAVTTTTQVIRRRLQPKPIKTATMEINPQPVRSGRKWRSDPAPIMEEDPPNHSKPPPVVIPSSQFIPQLVLPEDIDQVLPTPSTNIFAYASPEVITIMINEIVADVIAKHSLDFKYGEKAVSSKQLVQALTERLVAKFQAEGTAAVTTMSEALSLVADLSEIGRLSIDHAARLACESVVLSCCCLFIYRPGFIDTARKLLETDRKHGLAKGFEHEMTCWWRKNPPKRTATSEQDKQIALVGDARSLLLFHNALIHINVLYPTVPPSEDTNGGKSTKPTLKHTMALCSLVSDGRTFENGRGRSIMSECRHILVREECDLPIYRRVDRRSSGGVGGGACEVDGDDGGCDSEREGDEGEGFCGGGGKISAVTTNKKRRAPSTGPNKRETYAKQTLFSISTGAGAPDEDGAQGTKRVCGNDRQVGGGSLLAHNFDDEQEQCDKLAEVPPASAKVVKKKAAGRSNVTATKKSSKGRTTRSATSTSVMGGGDSMSLDPSCFAFGKEEEETNNDENAENHIVESSAFSSLAPLQPFGSGGAFSRCGSTGSNSNGSRSFANAALFATAFSTPRGSPVFFDGSAHASAAASGDSCNACVSDDDYHHQQQLQETHHGGHDAHHYMYACDGTATAFDGIGGVVLASGMWKEGSGGSSGVGGGLLYELGEASDMAFDDAGSSSE